MPLARFGRRAALGRIGREPEYGVPRHRQGQRDQPGNNTT